MREKRVKVPFEGKSEHVSAKWMSRKMFDEFWSDTIKATFILRTNWHLTNVMKIQEVVSSVSLIFNYFFLSFNLSFQLLNRWKIINQWVFSCFYALVKIAYRKWFFLTNKGSFMVTKKNLKKEGCWMKLSMKQTLCDWLTDSS